MFRYFTGMLISLIFNATISYSAVNFSKEEVIQVSLENLAVGTYAEEDYNFIDLTHVFVGQPLDYLDLLSFFLIFLVSLTVTITCLLYFAKLANPEKFKKPKDNNVDPDSDKT